MRVQLAVPPTVPAETRQCVKGAVAQMQRVTRDVTQTQCATRLLHRIVELRDRSSRAQQARVRLQCE